MIAVLASWPYRASGGGYPAGGLNIVLLIVLILVLLGRLQGQSRLRRRRGPIGSLSAARQERRKSHPTKVTVGLSSRKKGKKPRQKELFVAVPSGKQWATQTSRLLILRFGRYFACIGWQLQHRRV